jgi:hypothetical protein
MFKQLTLCLLASAGVLFAAELPTAEAVFNKSIEATGGKAGYEKVNTMLSRGTVEFTGQGIKGAIVLAFARPDKSDMVMDLPGLGKIRTGSGGGAAWQTSALQGPRVLQGEEREQIMRAAVPDSLVRWREVYGDVKVEGEETLDGKPCWRLVAHPPRISKPETLWFDKESGLLVKSVATLVSPMGEIPVESLYSDYRDAGGIKVAYSMRQATGPQVIVTTFTEVAVNAELPASQFDTPREIQALLSHP